MSTNVKKILRITALFAIDVFAIWVVTVSENIQFPQLFGNYHINAMLNGAIYSIVGTLIGSVFGMLLLLGPIIIAGVAELALETDGCIMSGCACSSLVVMTTINTVVSMLLSLYLYKLIYFFPQFSLGQALAITFISVAASLILTDYKSHFEKFKEMKEN